MEYLSIIETIEYTGKSLSTIRRYVADLKKQKSKHIKESYSNNGKKTITISIEAVKKLSGKIPVQNERVNEQSENTQNKSNEQEFINFLKSEIEQKNNQIEELLKQNNQFQIMLFNTTGKALETGTKKIRWWQRKNK